MDTHNSLQKMKNFILYATIALLVIGGVIAIFMIFFGANNTLLQCLATIGILYLMTLLSANNFSHNDSPYLSTRVCSNVASVMNLFWAVPWILLVWGVFGPESALVEMVWRLMWTALIIAVYFTVISTQLPALDNFKGLVRVKQAIPIFLITYIAINVIVYVWVITMRYVVDVDIIFRLCCAELILIVLQWAIPEILLRNQDKQHPAAPVKSGPQIAASVNMQQNTAKPVTNPEKPKTEPKPETTVKSDKTKVVEEE